MSLEQLIDRLVSRGVTGGIDAGPGRQQQVDDRQMAGLGFMDGGPDRVPQQSAAVDIPVLQRRAPRNQKFYRFHLPAVHRPMQAIESGVVTGGDGHAPIEKVSNSTGFTIEAGTGKCLRPRLRLLVKPAERIPPNHATQPIIDSRVRRKEKCQPGKIPSKQAFDGLSE
jgi:hypothetical protein